jgi:hypothetical protein
MDACSRPVTHHHRMHAWSWSRPCRAGAVPTDDTAVVILIRTSSDIDLLAALLARTTPHPRARTYPLENRPAPRTTTLDRGPCARAPSVSGRTPCTQNHPGTGESGDISQRNGWSSHSLANRSTNRGRQGQQASSGHRGCSLGPRP